MFNNVYASNISAFTSSAARNNRFAAEAAARGDKITEMNHRRAAIQTEALIADMLIASQKAGR